MLNIGPHALRRGVVAFGDPVENSGSAVAAAAQFGRDHQPFGLAEGRGLEVVTYIYIRNVQLPELAGHGGVFARHAIQQHDAGAHDGQQLEIEVGVVADVAHFAAEPVGPDVGVGYVVDARHTLDAAHLAQRVEQGYVARREAGHAVHRRPDCLSVEIDRCVVVVVEHQQMLLHLFGALPRIADGDQGRRVVFRAADVEAGGVGRGVERAVEIGRRVVPAAFAGRKRQDRQDAREYV